MKPTSIIFLIVSVAIIIGGFATAGVANQLAAAEGIELGAPDKDDGANVFTYEYAADAIGKISIDLEAATVNVIGGAAKPYVELINFAEGMYEFSSSNRVLTVRDGADIASFEGIAAMVMNFKGLRTFVNYFDMKDLERTVNIYVCDEYPVNMIDVSIDAGSVNIKDNDTPTDYSVDITAGELNMLNIVTTSTVKASVEAGNINLEKCDIEQMTASLITGNFDVAAHINSLKASIITGDFNYAFYGAMDQTNVKIFANVGAITIDGEEIGGYIETNEVATENIIDVNVSVGDVTIKSRSAR